MIGPISLQGSSAWDSVYALSGQADPSAISQQMAERLFKKVDSDGNGYISIDEFVTLLEQILARMSKAKSTESMPSAEDVFKAADTDGDGAISKDEFLNMLEQLRANRPQPANVREMPSDEDVFKTADTDGNGVVSKDEFVNMLAQMQERMSQVAGTSNMPSAEDIFKTADTDGDGALSQAEFSAVRNMMKQPPSIDSRGAGLLLSLVSDMLSQDNASDNSDSAVSVRDLLALFNPAGLEKYIQTQTSSTVEFVA